MDDFWRTFTTKTPGKGECNRYNPQIQADTNLTPATTLLPKNELAERLAKRTAAKDLAGGSTKTTATSYDEAAAACRAKVAQIVAECRRINQKYRDLHFDLDFDLRSGTRDCLESLSNESRDYVEADADQDPRIIRIPDRSSSGSRSPSPDRRRRRRHRHMVPGAEKPDRAKAAYGVWPGSHLCPRAVKRVGEIFDDPMFYIDGPTANDVRQGRDGDCWLMAALSTLSNKPGLIERVCVARDENVGVYGFVFHRDGEWFSEIIDDKVSVLLNNR
jgi:hypothetical protein